MTALGIRHRFSSFSASGPAGGAAPRSVRGRSLGQVPCRTACRSGARRGSTVSTGGQSQRSCCGSTPHVGQSPRQSSRHRRCSGSGQEELLAHHLAQVEPIASVVGDDHVAVGQLDLVLLLLVCAALRAAGRRGPAPASSASGNGSRQRPHCRPSRAVRRPRTWTVSSSPLLEGPRRRPPFRVKLSSPSRWTSPGSRAASTGCPSGGILETWMTRPSMVCARSNARFYGFRLDCQATWRQRPVRCPAGTSRRRRGAAARSSRPGSGPRSAKVSRTPEVRARPAPGPRGRAAGTFSRVWSVETSEGSQPWSAVSRKTSSVAQRGEDLGHPRVERLQVRRVARRRRCDGRRACRSRRGS